MNVRYVPEALAEYEAAAAWYDDHSTGAGDDFADAIERAELLIAETPRTWPQWPGARTAPHRSGVDLGRTGPGLGPHRSGVDLRANSQ